MERCFAVSASIGRRIKVIIMTQLSDLLNFLTCFRCGCKSITVWIFALFSAQRPRKLPKTTFGAPCPYQILHFSGACFHSSSTAAILAKCSTPERRTQSRCNQARGRKPTSFFRYFSCIFNKLNQVRKLSPEQGICLFVFFLNPFVRM